MILELIIIVVAMVCLSGMCTGAGVSALTWCLDAPSLICILILSVPLLFRKGMGKDFIRALKMQFGKQSYTLGEMRRSLDAVEFMQKQVLYAGLVTLILPIIFILGELTDIQVVGKNLSVALIALLYTAFLELLLLPLQLEAKRRIVNYMEEE